jgi:hypothetical protein
MQPQHFKTNIFEQLGGVPTAGIVPKLEQPMALKIKRIFCHLPHRLKLIVERSIYLLCVMLKIEKIKLPVIILLVWMVLRCVVSGLIVGEFSVLCCVYLNTKIHRKTQKQQITKHPISVLTIINLINQQRLRRG